MKKLILLLLVFTLKISAQSEVNRADCYLDNNYLLLASKSNCIFSIVNNESCKNGNDSCVTTSFVCINSLENGKLMNKIPLPQKDYIIKDFQLSHDEKSFIICSVDNYSKYKDGPYVIKKYFLEQDQWDWEITLEKGVTVFRLSFNEDNKQIICVTSKYLLIIDSETGKIKKKSDAISSIIYPEEKLAKYELSKNGRYFAYWEAKYLAWSSGDDLGLFSFIDLLWYGARWMFFLGSIPQQVYVWDIYQDELYDEIPIPFESDRGTPAFTEDEKELLLGSFEGNYKVYSVPEKKVTRSFFQKESAYSPLDERINISSPDYKVISKDTGLFANYYLSTIYVIDYKNGSLVKRFNDSLSSVVGNKHAMAFSPDGKYFALGVEKNKIVLLDTRTWEKVWEVNDMCGK